MINGGVGVSLTRSVLSGGDDGQIMSIYSVPFRRFSFLGTDFISQTWIWHIIRLLLFMIRRSFSPTRRTMLSLTTTRPYHNYPTSWYETELRHEKFSHPFDSRDDPGTLTTENLVNLFPPHINTNFLGPSLCKRALLRFSHCCLVLRIYSNSSVDVYSIIFEHKAHYPLRIDHPLFCCHFF